LAEEGPDPLLAELALAEVGVAVAVGAERHLGVVQVQAAKALEAELAVARVDDGGERLRLAHLVARGQQVTGVETDAEPAVATGALDHGGQLLEAAPNGSSRAGGVLEQQRALRGGSERAREGVPDQL